MAAMKRSTTEIRAAFWHSLVRDTRKIRVFAFSGAVGCLVAAFLGEIWLRATYIPAASQVSDYTICLLLDTSGSMHGEKFQEMKRAATEFVRGRDLSHDKLAIVGFGSHSYTATTLTRDASALAAAIEELEDGGGTNMMAGLRTAAAVVSGSDGPKSIMLFTDGMPDNQEAALQAAEFCRQNRTEIVAVATGDANVDFLAHATGNPQLVFSANTGQFSSAFQQASKVIGRRQLLESEGGGGSYLREVTRLAVWTALIAAGLALALVVGQNVYFGRPLWRTAEGGPAILGGLAVGAVAGTVVQGAFGAVTMLPEMLVLAGRLAGWTALGAMIGVAITRFVPNLRLKRGLLGGAVGGWIGGILFLVLAIVGETGGRLSGATAVGLAIGGMIAIAEVAGRRAWLDVVYGPKEKRSITLGQQALTAGSNKEYCQILIMGVPPVALRYLLKDNRVMLEDVPVGRMFEVHDGDTRQVGKVSLVVRRAAGSMASSDSPSKHQPFHVEEPATSPGQKWAAALDRAVPTSMGTGVSLAPAAAADRAAHATGFFLNARGRVLPLVEGARFTAQHLELRDGFSPAEVCAEVVPNPAQPGVFGLKNLTQIRWRAVLASGEAREIEPGKSIRLAKGTQITVGQSSLLIE